MINFENALELTRERYRAARNQMIAAFKLANIDVTDRDVYLLSGWINGPSDDKTRHQDPLSRTLIDNVNLCANQLGLAVQAAYEQSGFANCDDVSTQPNDDGLNINLCERFFYSKDHSASQVYEDITTNIMFLMAQAETCLGHGIKPANRGRPPLLSYYSFIRELYALYSTKASSKGFYKKNGTGEGPFVDVVEAAQTILPEPMRLHERKTIANRVLQAFRGDNLTAR